jgi:hypothetical protein
MNFKQRQQVELDVLRKIVKASINKPTFTPSKTLSFEFWRFKDFGIVRVG